jgi:kexin
VVGRDILEMKLHSILGLLGLGFVASASNLHARNYEAQDYYVLHLDSSTSPSLVAERLGLDHQGQLGELADHHIFSCHKQDEDIVHKELTELRRRKRSIGGSDILDGVKSSQKQKLKARMEKRGPIPPPPEGYTAPVARQAPEAPDTAAQAKLDSVAQTLGINDPIFKEQWHLFNPVQVGHDVNVTDVWLQGVTGFNATVAIVDDGLDMYSDDLKDNYYAEGSYDFNDNTLEPKPRLSDDRHGTRCAGEVSAVKNNICGVGVAYDSKSTPARGDLQMMEDPWMLLEYSLRKRWSMPCRMVVAGKAPSTYLHLETERQTMTTAILMDIPTAFTVSQLEPLIERDFIHIIRKSAQLSWS